MSSTPSSSTTPTQPVPVLKDQLIVLSPKETYQLALALHAHIEQYDSTVSLFRTPTHASLSVSALRNQPIHGIIHRNDITGAEQIFSLTRTASRTNSWIHECRKE